MGCERAILYFIITVIAVAANAFTAAATFARARFVVDNLGDVHLPHSSVPVFASLQAAGALGLLLGLVGMPVLGATAAAALVLFFLGAIMVHLRARAYRSLPSPVVFFLLAVATFLVAVNR
jgi:hypothetical protein